MHVSGMKTFLSNVIPIFNTNLIFSPFKPDRRDRGMSIFVWDLDLKVASITYLVTLAIMHK